MSWKSSGVHVTAVWERRRQGKIAEKRCSFTISRSHLTHLQIKSKLSWTPPNQPETYEEKCIYRYFTF